MDMLMISLGSMVMVIVSMTDGDDDDAPEAVWLLEQFLYLLGDSAGALGHTPGTTSQVNINTTYKLEIQTHNTIEHTMFRTNA